MSHTNQTQYYELPQYVGTDIINPLVDTNGAYEKIDTTMHNIAEIAGQSATDISELQSKVGTGVFATIAQNATGAVNELYDELNDTGTGIKDRVISVENDVDTLQSQMVTAQGNITDLQNNKFDKAGGVITGNVVVEKTNETALFTAVDHTSSGNNIVELYADDEGGNIALKKANDIAHVQLDTFTMNGSDGYARMYVGDSTTELKSEYKFSEQGYFEAPKVQAVNTDTASEIYAIQKNTGEANDYVLIKADNEGGNVRLQRKDGLHAELDTFSMNGSTGNVRLYLGDINAEQTKSFNFNEDGSFTDGNGVNTSALKSAVDSLFDYAVSNPACNATYFTNKVISIVKYGKLVIGNIGIPCDADIPVGNIVMATLPYPAKNGINFALSAIFQPSVTLSGYIADNSTDLHLQVDGSPLLTTDSFIRGEFVYITD